MQPRLGASGNSPGSESQLQRCNNKSVIGGKLGTSENPAVLKEPPVSTNENMIDLLARLAIVGVPCILVAFE